MSLDSTRSARRDSRNQKIRQRYAALYAKGQRSEVVVRNLSQEFFLSEGTILAIVFQWGHYRGEEPAMDSSG
ncbi:hypothetical protein ACO2Q8_04060 [Larkinella sp. VNQ87]|uniref:hypothetical protein n=1 Tax=Larkinella sp. VNQ87 TaxID=3400921 RepID=UPI003BFCB660